MLGLFIELKFCMAAIYFLNYHKNVTCSFISLLQYITSSLTYRTFNSFTGILLHGNVP